MTLDWPRDWPSLAERFAWIRAMDGCPQDAIHHAEGDVGTHVRMVLDAFDASPEADNELLRVAVLLHDVAKPECTRHEPDGRISSRGHSARGAIQARRILWEEGADPHEREQVCALIRHHQVPFHLIDRPNAARRLRLMSQSTRCDWLQALARADGQGRRCHYQASILEKVALFGELCREHGCEHEPWPFASPLSRFEYARHEHRDPHYAAHDQSRCEVILLCGLPAAGKDTWIRNHAADLPVVSLDDLRDELDGEGAVVQAARALARQHLREHQSFIWNATNLRRERRAQLVDLFSGYHASTRIVYIEAPATELFTRNRERERPVPEAALQRMLDHWDVPAPEEAPAVEWHL